MQPLLGTNILCKAGFSVVLDFSHPRHVLTTEVAPLLGMNSPHFASGLGLGLGFLSFSLFVTLLCVSM